MYGYGTQRVQANSWRNITNTPSQGIMGNKNPISAYVGPGANPFGGVAASMFGAGRGGLGGGSGLGGGLGNYSAGKLADFGNSGVQDKMRLWTDLVGGDMRSNMQSTVNRAAQAGVQRGGAGVQGGLSNAAGMTLEGLRNIAGQTGQLMQQGWANQKTLADAQWSQAMQQQQLQDANQKFAIQQAAQLAAQKADWELKQQNILLGQRDKQVQWEQGAASRAEQKKRQDADWQNRVRQDSEAKRKNQSIANSFFPTQPMEGVLPNNWRNYEYNNYLKKGGNMS